jgi:hypothetical protein
MRACGGFWCLPGAFPRRCRRNPRAFPLRSPCIHGLENCWSGWGERGATSSGQRVLGTSYRWRTVEDRRWTIVTKTTSRDRQGAVFLAFVPAHTASSRSRRTNFKNIIKVIKLVLTPGPNCDTNTIMTNLMNYKPGQNCCRVAFRMLSETRGTSRGGFT